MATQILAQPVAEFLRGIHENGTERAFRTVERALASRQMLALPDEDVNITCLAGELWLTRHGDIEDYILGPGQSFAARRGSRAAVQALKPSRLLLRAA